MGTVDEDRAGLDADRAADQGRAALATRQVLQAHVPAQLDALDDGPLLGTKPSPSL